LSGAVALAALQAYLLLTSWSGTVAVVVLVLGFVAAAGFFLRPEVVVPIALVAALIGPAAHSVTTAATPHSGAIPSAGPSGAGGSRGGGGGGLGELLSAPTPGAELVSLLRSGSQTWAGDAAQEIAAWVRENFAGSAVDGVAVHDLTAGAQRWHTEHPAPASTVGP
jgi:hypothetical protein